MKEKVVTVLAYLVVDKVVEGSDATDERGKVHDLGRHV